MQYSLDFNAYKICYSYTKSSVLFNMIELVINKNAYYSIPSAPWH